MSEEILKDKEEQTEPEAEKAEAGTEKAAEAEEAKEPEAEAAEAGEKAEGPKSEDAKKQEDLQMQYMRLAADFQNFRKRTEKERADIYAFACEGFASDLLNVMDNFERAMEAAPEDDKFAEGMGLIFKQLQDVLKKNKVEEIAAQDAAFDPNFHNAVMTEPAPEGEDGGKVTKVLQKGYTLNGKVIRPSMVAVSQ
ncbi:MAG: nucleotide exchange factor GrpE [Firmicutes bacterium]|nr:nucleotide exchange factor GrpE [Bacillota bacterium]